jgi:predicted dehydrogenase
VTHVCDVESNILAKFAALTEKELGYAAKAEGDFRNVLAARDVDAITIATPDHWHTPMAILGLKAGKNVYVEKPCSHNPGEGALLLQATQKFSHLKVQMGTQQRSFASSMEIVDKIHNGAIGRAYAAKAWYVNTRGSIGVGKEEAPPATLNWDLFQGPAPRQAYRSNYQPYNWHWFKIYGTGEALNNGTHEVDVCRWALGVEFPTRVTAAAGRYQFKDDWQFYDTMMTNFEYPDHLITWDGKCCNGMKDYGRDRGALIMGTTGSAIIDRGGYEVYDLKGRKTDEHKVGHAAASSDTIGADAMTDAHFANFIGAIKKGEALHAPISVGNVAVTMLQLSNIAWETKHELNLDPSNGRIQNDAAAMKLWARTYEKGWAPTLS